MNNHLYFRAVSSTLFAALGAMSTVAGPEQKDIDEAKRAAWRNAGAEFGWMKDRPPQADSNNSWNPWREKTEKDAILAFRFPNRISDADFAKLPNLSGHFGLDFHCGFYAGVSLKQLANLKNLHSLNLGGANQGTSYSDLKDLSALDDLRALYLFQLQIKDSQLKYLAKMKKLEVLDLSHTNVTNEGVKDLAQIKSLRWLNLWHSEITASGVAQLRKELPDCKIAHSSDLRK